MITFKNISTRSAYSIAQVCSHLPPRVRTSLLHTLEDRQPRQHTWTSTTVLEDEVTNGWSDDGRQLNWYILTFLKINWALLYNFNKPDFEFIICYKTERQLYTSCHHNELQYLEYNIKVIKFLISMNRPKAQLKREPE